MEKKIIRAARAAKEEGYIYISSVVKGYKGSTYHHFVKIDDVLERGAWIPAQKRRFQNGGVCKAGVTARNLPDNCISRREAFKLVD